MFESDDWGLCGEGKDRKTHERLSSLGYDMHLSEPHPAFSNTLETEQDLDLLYSILLSFSDSLGRPPVFTSNVVTSNPDFQRIRTNSFRSYEAVPIYDGFPSGWNGVKSLVRAWRKGIDRKVWIPEYHGYAHFSYRGWLAGLRRGEKRPLDFFDEEMVSFSNHPGSLMEYGSVAGSSRGYLPFAEQCSDIEEGCRIFRRTFGYQPMSSIPPYDYWNIYTLLSFYRQNIRCVNTERTRLRSVTGVSLASPGTLKRSLQAVFLQATLLRKLCRNIRLELENRDETSAIEATQFMFKLGSPAVVGSHRVNYVGSVHPSVAEVGRRKLRGYLRAITEDNNLIFLVDSELFQLFSKGYSVMKIGNEILIRNHRRNDIVTLVNITDPYSSRDLTKDSSINVEASRSEVGLKVRIPAGRTVSLTVSRDAY